MRPSEESWRQQLQTPSTYFGIEGDGLLSFGRGSSWAVLARRHPHIVWIILSCCIILLLVLYAWSKAVEQVTSKGGSRRTSRVSEVGLEGASQKHVWLRVAAVYIACVMAPGVLQIWPVVQPIFVAHGLFGEDCNGNGAPNGCDDQEDALSFVYLAAFSLTQIATWPVGLVFDTLGPRMCATLGAVICCVAQLCIALSVTYPHYARYLLFPGAIFADVGGNMNGYALLGFLWHAPDHQGLIAGIQSSSSSAGCLAVLVIVNLLPFQPALWLLVCVSASAAIICFLAVPSQEEYVSEASRSLGAREIEDQSSGQKFRSCWTCFNLYFEDNLYFTISSVCLLSFFGYWTSVTSPYLEALISTDAASQITKFYCVAYGVVGIVLGPVSGILSDMFGLKAFVLTITVLNIVQVSTIFVPNVSAQMVGAFASAAFGALYVTYCSRWFALYSPPEHFGNFGGFIMSACGVLSMLVSLVLYLISTFALTGLSSFQVPLAVAATCSIFSTCAFVSHIMKRDLPTEPPELTIEY